MPIGRRSYTIDVSRIKGLSDSAPVVLELYPHDVENARTGFRPVRNTICQDVRAALRRTKRIPKGRPLRFGYNDLKIS